MRKGAGDLELQVISKQRRKKAADRDAKAVREFDRLERKIF